MRVRSTTLLLGLVTVLPACTSKDAGPTDPGVATATVRFVARTPTTRQPGLTPAQETCARTTGPTHLHPSWRGFESFMMTAVGTDRYELTLQNVPAGTRLQVQVGDQNACVSDPDGWMTSNVLANDVTLTQVVNVNNGKGFAFTVASSGTVTP